MLTSDGLLIVLGNGTAGARYGLGATSPEHIRATRNCRPKRPSRNWQNCTSCEFLSRFPAFRRERIKKSTADGPCLDHMAIRLFVQLDTSCLDGAEMASRGKNATLRDQRRVVGIY